MAKGGSESAAEELECQEHAGEHLRAVARVGDGEGAGTGDPDEAAPVGRRGPATPVRRPVQPRGGSGLPGNSLESGPGEQGLALSRGGWANGLLHRSEQARRRWVSGGVAS